MGAWVQMGSSDDSSADAVLFLRMQPSWVLVDEIRRFVETFCANACPRAGREEQLALAAHELVQNAIANAITPDVELRLEVDRAAERVRLSVSNLARAEELEELREAVARVQSYANPLAGFVAALRVDPESHGGIGLARIRYEAALELSLDVDGARVTVHAAGPLSAPPPEALLPHAFLLQH